MALKYVWCKLFKGVGGEGIDISSAIYLKGPDEIPAPFMEYCALLDAAAGGMKHGISQGAIEGIGTRTEQCIKSSGNNYLWYVFDVDIWYAAHSKVHKKVEP